MRKLILALGLLLIAAYAWGAIASPGYSLEGKTASTDPFEVQIYSNSSYKYVDGLSIAPVSADIELLLYPLAPSTANFDTITVRAGDVMNFTAGKNLKINGFKVIRTSSTAVDCYWW